MLARPFRASLAVEAGGAVGDAADAGVAGDPAEAIAVGATESGACGFWVQAETAENIKAHASRAPNPGETENGSERPTIGARLPQRLGSREALVGILTSSAARAERISSPGVRDGEGYWRPCIPRGR